MNDRIIGHVKRVNGPIIEVMGITDAEMFELVRVGNENLIGELIKLETDGAVVQVYEDTTGIAPHDPVYGAGMQLSVELGPGMVGTIYDGIQRPLESIRDMSEIYIKRGITVPSLDRDKKWHFIPTAKTGDIVSGGMVLGTVQENENLLHKILVAPNDSGTIESIVPEGDYTVEEVIAVLNTDGSQNTSLKSASGAACGKNSSMTCRTYSCRFERNSRGISWAAKGNPGFPFDEPRPARSGAYWMKPPLHTRTCPVTKSDSGRQKRRRALRRSTEPG